MPDKFDGTLEISEPYEDTEPLLGHTSDDVSAIEEFIKEVYNTMNIGCGMKYYCGDAMTLEDFVDVITADVEDGNLSWETPIAVGLIGFGK